MDNITVILQPYVTMYTVLGVQGPAGPQGAAGVGYVDFTDLETMFATTGAGGQIAYPHDPNNPDQFYKWSVVAGAWVPAAI